MLYFLIVCFYGISVCADMCVSKYLCVSCGFSLVLLFLFSPIPLCWPICFLMKERKKGKGRGEGLEGSHQNTLHKRNLFSIKIEVLVLVFLYFCTAA